MPFEFWIWLVAWAAFGRLIIIYGFGSPWYQTAIGRSLFPMKVALFLLFTWVLSVFLFKHYPGSDALRVFCLSFITFMAIWQGRVWRRVQRQTANKQSDPLEEGDPGGVQEPQLQRAQRASRRSHFLGRAGRIPRRGRVERRAGRS